MNASITIFDSITPVVSSEYTYYGPRFLAYNVCISQPQKLIYDGIWAGDSPSKHTYTMLELQILTIFIVTQGFHFFLKRLGFSYFVSQVMAGFLLGPSIPTGPLEKFKVKLFPYGSPDVIYTISSFGYAFLLFLISIQMDFTLITKTGKKAWVIACLTIFTPIILGFTITVEGFDFWKKHIGGQEANGLPVVVISHSGCSFAVIASLLNDLQILNSELGRLALSSAFLTDLFGSIISGFGTVIVSNALGKNPLRSLGLYVGFLIGVPLFGRPVMLWMVRNTPEGKSVNKIYIHGIVVTFVLLGILAGYADQPFLTAAIVLGLAVPEGPPLGSELVYQFELFVVWFLSPIFVTCCAMKVDITKCGPPKLIAVIALFILMTHLIKLLVCVGVCRYCKMPPSDGLCLALILSCKGIVDTVAYILVYDALVQSPEAVSIMVVSILILGSISRIGVKNLYDPSRKYAGYQKRNIMNLKQNFELRLIVCVHKPNNVVHMKNFLHLCSPAPDNALIVDVLHLMELVGRTTPIFIAHRLQRKAVSTHNYSGELVVTFDLFEREYAGSATVNTYTAISPVTLMHEDVCRLALNKNAAIIVLPFHIKWAEDGSIEYVDNNIRSLNSKVLEISPCSIGILVNGGGTTCNHYANVRYKVAMIFLGGPDDREALCLSKRFAKNMDNILSVYRLRAHDHDSMAWEHMIDDEEIRQVSGAYVKLENVTYEEKTIDDASQTTNFIREIANKFDFIVVGRRNGIKSSQTTGLETWTEYTELGVIGDLLASPDMKTKASILVVQQQQTTSMSC